MPVILNDWNELYKKAEILALALDSAGIDRAIYHIYSETAEYMNKNAIIHLYYSGNSWLLLKQTDNGIQSIRSYRNFKKAAMGLIDALVPEKEINKKTRKLFLKMSHRL